MGKSEKLVGLFGVHIYEQNVMPFTQIMKRVCEERGYRLLAFSGSTFSIEDTEEIQGQYEFVDLIYQVDICALIILTENIRNESTIQRLVQTGQKKGIPVFSLDRKIEGCYNLLMDNENCFEKIMRHVVEDHKVRYINFIGGDVGNRFSEERIAVYKKVLEENGIPFEQERIGYGYYWERPVAGVIQKFLESKLPFPEAIICANDIMAHAAITVLNEHGYEVPEDVIVTGYDGTRDGNFFFPSMTTGAPDYEQMIELLFDEITKCIENNRIEACDIVVPVRMKVRQSCGCEPKMIPKNDRRISQLLTEIGNGKRHMEEMQWMLSDTLGKKKIEDILPYIPMHMDVWFDFYRYVGIKSELFHSYEISEESTELTCILEGCRGVYRETGKTMELSDLNAFIHRVLEEEKMNIVLVHPLISGKNVYGFSIEGFEKIVDWQIKQCDEFAMFLSHILHSVIHDFKLNKLNEDLKKINSEVEMMSLHDSMTGIYNRRGFFRVVNQLTQKTENQGKYIYMIMVDMDGLKYINDNFGHAEGDFAIVTLAKTLARMGKEKYICARVGGDEFICSYVDDEEYRFSAESFSTRMEELLREAEEVADKEYTVAASVGMMCEKITQDLDLDAMINGADDKMYGRKIARKMRRD